MNAGNSTGIYNFVLELLAAVAVYAVALRRKPAFPLRLVTVVIVAALSLLLIQWNIPEQNVLTIQPFQVISLGLQLVGLLLVVVLALLSLFRVSVTEAVFTVVIAYLTEHIAYCLRILIALAGPQFDTSAGSLLYFGIHLAVYVISWFMFARRMIRRKHYEPELLQSLWLSLATVFLVIVMSLAATAFGFETIHAIYALFACYFVLYSQVYQLGRSRYRRELEQNHQLWARHKAQYEMASENIELLNRKSHDLKHHISALRLLKSGEEIDAALDDLERAALMYDAIIETGNTILDTVLTEKSLICTDKGLTLNCIADGALLDFMDTVDLYALFGNALDNAIRAASACDDAEVIRVFVRQRLGVIVVQIENSYCNELRFKQGLPVSDKQNASEHGYGLKSIYHICESYGGQASVEASDAIFVLRLTFPAQ